MPPTAESELGLPPFVHPIEIVIDGQYADILDYLEALEALPWKFRWSSLELSPRVIRATACASCCRRSASIPPGSGSDMRRRSDLTALCVALMLTGITRAGELRDPMRPAGAPAAAASRPAPVYTLKLEGVIAGAERVAIINGRAGPRGRRPSPARRFSKCSPTACVIRAPARSRSLTLPGARADVGVRVARSSPRDPRQKP